MLRLALWLADPANTQRPVPTWLAALAGALAVALGAIALLQALCGPRLEEWIRWLLP